MKDINFNREEVMAYLEYKITHGEATDDEMELYEGLVWDDLTYKINYKTCLRLKREMIEIWEAK